MSVYTLKDTCYAFSIIYRWFRPNVRINFKILTSTFLTSTILPISRLYTCKQINHVRTHPSTHSEDRGDWACTRARAGNTLTNPPEALQLTRTRRSDHLSYFQPWYQDERRLPSTKHHPHFPSSILCALEGVTTRPHFLLNVGICVGVARDGPQ